MIRKPQRRRGRRGRGRRNNPDTNGFDITSSPTFAPVQVKEIPQFIQAAKKNGEMATIRAFRTWVRSLI